MTCSNVKLACCRLCGETIASNLGACIHCGVCKPVKQEKTGLLQKILLGLLIAGTVIATLRYEARHRVDPDCGVQEIRRSGVC